MRKDMLDLIQEKGERVKEKARKTMPERKKQTPNPEKRAHTVIIKSKQQFKKPVP